MQETSATEVCVSTFSFFLREKGVRLGLVVEGEDGRLGLALMMIRLQLHSPSALESWARQARDKRYWSVWILIQFLQADPGLAIPPFTLISWLTAW